MCIHLLPIWVLGVVNLAQLQSCFARLFVVVCLLPSFYCVLYIVLNLEKI